MVDTTVPAEASSTVTVPTWNGGPGGCGDGRLSVLDAGAPAEPTVGKLVPCPPRPGCCADARPSPTATTATIATTAATKKALRRRTRRETRYLPTISDHRPSRLPLRVTAGLLRYGLPARAQAINARRRLRQRDTIDGPIAEQELRSARRTDLLAP